MFTDTLHKSGNAAGLVPQIERRAPRHAVEMLARYAWKGLRGTVLLRDLTDRGARIEGLEALRQGDGIMLLLPGQPALDSTVAWALGRAAGLSFDQQLDADDLATLIRDFAPCSRPPLTPESLPVLSPRRGCA